MTRVAAFLAVLLAAVLRPQAPAPQAPAPQDRSSPPSVDELARLRLEVEGLRAEKARREAEERDARLVSAIVARVSAELERVVREQQKLAAEAAAGLRREIEPLADRIAALEGRVAGLAQKVDRIAAAPRERGAATGLRRENELPADPAAALEGRLTELAERVERVTAESRERAAAAAARKTDEERIRDAALAELRSETRLLTDTVKDLRARNDALTNALIESQTRMQAALDRLGKEIVERATEGGRKVNASSDRPERLPVPAGTGEAKEPPQDSPAPIPSPNRPATQSRPRGRLTDATPTTRSEPGLAAGPVAGELPGGAGEDVAAGKGRVPIASRPSPPAGDAREPAVLVGARAPPEDPRAATVDRAFAWTAPLVLLPAVALVVVCLAVLLRGRMAPAPAPSPPALSTPAAPCAPLPPTRASSLEAPARERIAPALAASPLPLAGAAPPPAAASPPPQPAPPPPRCIAVRLPLPAGAEGSRLLGEILHILRSEPGILVRPEPRVEPTAGSWGHSLCSVRFYVHGALSRADEAELVRKLEDAFVVR